MSPKEIAMALRSPELAVRMPVIEQAALHGAGCVDRVVATLEEFPEDAYFVLEQIGRFDEAAIDPLLTLYGRTQDAQVRLLCVLALAHFGRSVDRDLDLIDAVKNRSEYEHLACRALARLSSPAALPVLLDSLDQTSANERDRLASLIVAIRALGGDVPKSQEDRLRSSPFPEIATLFE